ncbi:hypothetical protein SI65_02496 [Aspergillus cristatus]|uniref:Uncharacterized protein n=1 Tax=Aspergillus cristatus TaxID=573508 RepID=A0A1E3BKZ9_ASPCR|nr:hypothetical protein SI65_02496 [Aspergillus cristatus]
MASQDEMNTAGERVSAPATQVQKSAVEFPSVEDILSDSTALPPRLPTERTDSLPAEEQTNLLRSLQEILKNFEGANEADVEAFKDVRSVLDKLWSCKLDYLVQAANVLANGSRNPSWRLPYGQSGILDFFLRLVASSEITDNELLLHSLRLGGNSCADTDENRLIVVKDNYTLAIIRRLLNPGLTQVVIPVLYNTCMDFESAHAQVAENRIAYILSKLIKDGAFSDNEALLDYSYELIELAAEQGKGVESSPDGTISLLLELAADKETTFSQSSCVVNSLVKYLENERFQHVCISNGMVERVLSVLQRSLSLEVNRSSVEEAKVLVQLQLKLNQTLAELSGSELFAKFYPLESPIFQTLKSWLTASEDQLQICSCVMLGNLARSDEVCEKMVCDLGLHKELISILKSDARGGVLHSSLGFLKNLAIAGNNRQHLGNAGIIPAIAPLWGYETVPQVQFAATSMARQLIVSSYENVTRLLEALPEGDASADKPTYLSLLLGLFEKTDSAPIKTEIGRSVASICRTLIPKAKESETSALLDSLFSLHKHIARPIGAMITQTQWPVVRSEGWFALALMASCKQGTAAAVDCLQNMEVYPLLENTLSASDSGSATEIEKVQRAKDRDNTIILVKELLSNDGALPEDWKASLEGLMNDHVSRAAFERK